MAKKKRKKNPAQGRWGVGPARHVAHTFVDRKKQANRDACRRKVNY